MIGEAKSFASLSAGLLARKGGARPAMRRQPLGQLGGPLGLTAHGAPSDDLGWNDMGYDVDPDLSPSNGSMDIKPMLAGSVMIAAEDAARAEDLRGAVDVPEVVRQQAELAERLTAAPEVAKARDVAEKKAKVKAARPKVVTAKSTNMSVKSKLRARDKAAFTLRLDPEQHLRLRLASAVSNRSSQAILIALLDEYLASLPEIGDLASRVPAVAAARITRSQ
jgi:hypothetical protein